jgi:uncharacterized membrane protein YccF (DUF307 family)
MSDGKGFFGSLFDLSFSSFITIRLVKVLYILTLILLALAYVVIAVAIFSGGDQEATSISLDGTVQTSDDDGNAVLGVLWLVIFGPLLMFFYVLFYRVIFELIVVVFRIFENTRDQLALTRRGAEPGGAPAEPPQAV